MNNNCLICSRIKAIKEGRNPYFVKELSTGYVVLGDYQFYKGYVLFLSKVHTNELHNLKEKRTQFLNEMAIVAESVYKFFKPNKLNYELLGNTDEHLHWHVIPRYNNDPNPNAPIWVINKNIRYSENVRPSENELKITIKQFREHLDNLLISRTSGS
jgi:diadenosine tetraphosphate (Ap4A) HIT family hydrolase